MTKRHLSQNDLESVALVRSTDAQRTALAKLQTNGFRIYRAITDGDQRTTVVLVTHPNTFGVVYPDGSFQRALANRKTVNVEWSRARHLRSLAA